MNSLMTGKSIALCITCWRVIILLDFIYNLKATEQMGFGLGRKFPEMGHNWQFLSIFNI